MATLIIGSTALHAIYGSEFREPKDLDLFSDDENFAPADDVLWDESFRHWIEYRPYGTVHGVLREYATPNELYTIKISHSHWELDNGSWSKHISDILFLQDKGAKLIPELY